MKSNDIYRIYIDFFFRALITSGLAPSANLSENTKFAMFIPAGTEQS